MKLSYILFFSLAVLAGCESQPIRSTADLGRLESQAQAQAESGNLGVAIGIYRQLAEASRGSQRTDYIIAGSRLALERSDWNVAQVWLADASANAAPTQQPPINVLRARAEVGLRRPESALQILAGVSPPLSQTLSRDIAEVRGLAFFALGRVVDAVQTLIDREIWLDDANAILANQYMIWEGLAGSASLAANVNRTGDSVVDGWLDVAPLAAIASDPVEFRRGLLEWRQRFVDHPAAAGILADLLAEQRLAGAQATRIALLLPLNSAVRAQALAVRDGFLAAHLQSANASEASVTIYDTAGSGSTAAYLQAQLEGADFIVGPLLPTNVEEVISQSGFVPTLALNFSQTEGALSQGFYQFALAPEDEAQAIAERAIAAGQTTAIALFASSDRGYRIAASFESAFRALGGRVLNTAAYVPETQNFGQTIRNLLDISSSQRRHQRLQANLGRAINFEPRRRQDVDMIFLQADPSLGRLLAPQLRFHDAGDIPTYATSDIFDPARQVNDPDLNGVVFPDLPLLLTPDRIAANLTDQLQQFWPQRARQWIRFYGFGFDAYQLVNQLYNQGAATWPMQGTTGGLDFAADGKIRRSLPFAQFQSGRPVPVAPIAPAPRPNEFSDRPAGFFGAR